MIYNINYLNITFCGSIDIIRDKIQVSLFAIYLLVLSKISIAK